MELPKNVTQIGEPDRSCKIYVEDYVMSYMKQLNVHARDKEMAVALYGNRQEEAGVTYLFFYGACRLNFLQRESRHLSQAVQQEAEELRQKFFSQYTFLGYRLLNGEMVEGFHVCEQGVCRYIEGYAQFYEKNDSMLAFMLADRKEAVRPEEVNQEKYDEVKKRQEERRLQSEEHRGQARLLLFGPRKAAENKPNQKNVPEQKPVEKTPVRNLRNMKYTAAAVFVLLFVAGFATMNNGGSLEDLKTAAGELLDQMNTQQIPDAMEAANNSVQAGSVVMEDNYSDALQQENEAALQAAGSGNVEIPSITPTETPTASPDNGTETESTPAPTPESTPEPTVEPTSEPTSEPTPAPVSYTVKWGDTLIAICIEHYGSDEMVARICDFNGITNPDDIKEGQKILLP